MGTLGGALVHLLDFGHASRVVAAARAMVSGPQIVAGGALTPVASPAATPPSDLVGFRPPVLLPDVTPQDRAKAGADRRAVQGAACHDCTCCAVLDARLATAAREARRLRYALAVAEGRGPAHPGLFVVPAQRAEASS